MEKEEKQVSLDDDEVGRKRIEMRRCSWKKMTRRERERRKKEIGYMEPRVTL